jgi:hypothetical protein
MEEIQKRPRGRPRTFPKDITDTVKRDFNVITRRGAQNHMYYAIALVKICDHCNIETQKYFLGGTTHEEILAGALPTQKTKRYVMEELGRHPEDEIAGIAEAIANNRAFDDWTQKEIVDVLRKCRLNPTAL